ncbi:MAG TPA: amidase [Caulobacteraceae bacterium]|jgi:amidase
MSEHYPVEEKSVATLQAAMAAGAVDSVGLVSAYLARIEAIDRSGPALRSVIALNPLALDDARRLDEERVAGRLRGPLHGIPVLVKDNIDTDDGTATTAGSLALADNVTRRDAPVVARLKTAGAVILGKTNLSEWANIRSTRSISGWSAVGGLVKNPYVLDRSPSGSSSGTGAAIAASLAAVGIGTETNGSVVAPSSVNGLVGLKPTLGLVSRTHIVPISSRQDTAGPMGRSVEDVAILLTAMAGPDPADPATAQAGDHACDYAAALRGASLKGRRLGVLGFASELSADVDAVFAAAMAILRAGGAEIITPDYKRPAEISANARTALMRELKSDLNAYLATTPAAVKARNLADLIAFNRANGREMALFGQDYFERAEATKGVEDEAWIEARQTAQRLAGPEGIDRLIADNRLDALVACTCGPASRIDFATGDHTSGRSAGLPAIAGYPHLTVPMGQVQGLPVGLSFIGPAWTEAVLLALGHAFEQAAQARKPPTYIASLEMTPQAELATAPNA